MEYKRLTKRFGGDVFDNCVNCDNDSNPMGCTEHCCYEVMKNRLAELEDKIEQGTLVDTGALYIEDGAKHGSAFPFVICRNFKEVHILDFCYDREEAEKRLKELQE